MESVQGKRGDNAMNDTQKTISHPENAKKVLFLCTHNSARSQMAEGLLKDLFGNRYRAFSAGTNPSSVNPHAISVMSEAGIDISDHRAKSIEEFIDAHMDYIVTVCDQARESCPYFPGGTVKIHKGFADPAAVSGSDEEKLQAFRSIRDEIRQWLLEAFQ